MEIKGYNQYQEKCEETAQFNEEIAIPYISMKMNGETGELTEAILLKKEPELIYKEFGDILWYIATMANRLDIKLVRLLTQFDRTHRLGDIVFAAESKGTQLAILNMFSGMVAETSGKILRDDHGVLTEKKRQKIVIDLASLFGWLTHFMWLNFAAMKFDGKGNVEATEFECTIWAMNMNYDKLQDRYKRDVIKGDGDVR